MTSRAEPENEADPFVAFDEGMNPGGVADPYPDFVVQRAEGPVRALDMGPWQPEDAAPVFEALSFEAVQAVFRDGRRFSSSFYDEALAPVMGHTILGMDDPEHRVHRSLIQQAFSKNALARWEADLIAPTIDGLIDDFEGDGHADLVRQLFFPFPVLVIAGMLGLPPEDLSRFHRLAVELVSVSFDVEVARRAGLELAEYLLPFVAARRTSPGDDLLSLLIAADDAGAHLSDEDIVSFARLLLPAGAETTYRSSSNLAFSLLSDPPLLDQVRRDRSLLPRAVEEGLRFEPPIVTLARTATTDTDVCGVAVPAGAVVIVNIGSANHDESRWPDGEHFDLFRDQQTHIAFATGPHTCLGMHLARLETTVVMNRVLTRLPGVRLDPEAPPPTITGMMFRAPRRLDVVWDTGTGGG
jgi:cytochrome P450